MATIIWNLADGSIISAEVADGTNLMNAAVANNVTGVVGECGGCLSCATCHVFVDAGWSERAGKPDGVEDAMLEITETPRTGLSRLSCQIIASAALDGLVLTVPQS
jgi:ferredoxin, 2Fe-2S